MLFAVALHSVANDYFAEKQAEQDIYMAMSTMKGDTHETVSSPQTPISLMPNWPGPEFRRIRSQCRAYSVYKRPNLFFL